MADFLDWQPVKNCQKVNPSTGGHKAKNELCFFFFGSYLVGGIPTPLKNDGVRQLGLLFPI